MTFWKAAPIQISQEIFVTSAHAMYVLRLLGLFPMSIQRDGSKLWLRWSPLYALLSYAFGIITLFLAYLGWMQDVLVEREKSVRMLTTTDIFVQFADITAVTIVHFFGIFINPFRYLTFAKYIRCMMEVDAIIPPVNLKTDRNLSIFMMCCVLLGIFTVLTIDMFMFFKNAEDRQPPIFVLKCYTAFYVAYHVMYGHMFLFWHMVHAIYKRVKLLNQHLLKSKVKYWLNRHSKVQAEKSLSLVAVMGWKKMKEMGMGDEKNFIYKLMKVYENLSDACEALNNLLGLNTGITLIGIMWHLIVLPYFFVASLTIHHKHIFFTIMQVVWTIISAARLMILIVQPCYECIMEVQKTKDKVCELLIMPDIDENFRSQLKIFSIVLQLKRFEFSTVGYTFLDRLLVTTMLGAATTYLVVLLQFATAK